MHPSGFHIIVGFSDKVRAMNLLMEDLRTFKEIPIKQCREIRFSNGGHQFAAVNGNQVQVYKTYTCELVANLSTPSNSRIKSITWSGDDSVLASCSADGNIYEFAVLQDGGRRISDWNNKGTSFSCVLLNNGSTAPVGGNMSKNLLYAVDSDRMIKELRSSQLSSYVETGLTLGQICLSSSSESTMKALFASVADPETVRAPIRIYKFPLEEKAPLQYACHSAPATRLRITQDDCYLFSVAEDGCLFIFEIKGRGAKVDAKKKDRTEAGGNNAMAYADEILVTRRFLDEKHGQLKDLERQVAELLNQIEFQLSHRDSYHKEKMAELEERYGQEIEQERAKYSSSIFS